MKEERRLPIALLISVVTLFPTYAVPITAGDLLNADANQEEWILYGRDYRNQRFSPLTQITTDNVARLLPVWTLSTEGHRAGLESTPLFRDGTLYFSADYSRVFAVDATTGAVKWSYEPAYEEGLKAVLCCGPVNRGVALAGDFVYVGTLDARLVALNRANGSVVWEQKVDDWKEGVSITGVPMVVGDTIFVGIAGGEFGVRGYLKAFDAKSGAPKWTTYTIPRPGEVGSETWPKNDSWRTGGGTTWLTGAYDAESDTLLWGTGNPAPWPSDTRPGDNLYTNSLLGLDPASGRIKWYYQYTPNDSWDYDAVNAPILADVMIDGESVKAAFQSNRNGFFYVLDRTDGRFVYAIPTIDDINWTTGLDPATGRPTINEEKVPVSGGVRVSDIIPGVEGGTNWHPSAYNPDLGYAFITTNNWGMELQAWKRDKLKYGAGATFVGADYQMSELGPITGYVKAIDVRNRKIVWEAPSPLPLFAGLLATKSGLVFTGDQRGYFIAYDARTGEELWKFQTGSGINASPMTYELDGKQYVAILSGLRGAPTSYSAANGGTLWVFAVDGI